MFLFWLVVSTPLNNISQNGNLPPNRVKIKHIRNHHLVFNWMILRFHVNFAGCNFQAFPNWPQTSRTLPLFRSYPGHKKGSNMADWSTRGHLQHILGAYGGSIVLNHCHIDVWINKQVHIDHKLYELTYWNMSYEYTCKYQINSNMPVLKPENLPLEGCHYRRHLWFTAANFCHLNFLCRSLQPPGISVQGHHPQQGSVCIRICSPSGMLT